MGVFLGAAQLPFPYDESGGLAKSGHGVAGIQSSLSVWSNESGLVYRLFSSDNDIRIRTNIPDRAKETRRGDG